TGAFLNLPAQFWDVCFQVNQQVRWAHEVYHCIKKIEITLVVPIRDKATSVQISREYVCILVDSTILYCSPFASADLMNLFEPCIQEINLNMVRPTFHVLIKVAEIGIIIN